MTKLYEYVCDAFISEGTRAVFGLMGDGNMLWLAEMAARASVEVVHARHEATALAISDGWSQSSGEVGVCSVTCGPGLTNLVTSLRVAAHNQTPIVVFAGDTPIGATAHYQEFDVQSLSVAAGVDVLEIRAATDAPLLVAEAFARARRERKPVVLTMPYDLAEEAHELGAYAPRVEDNTPPAPDPAMVLQVAARLHASENVLLLIGRGAVASGAVADALELAEHLSAYVGTTVKALGASYGVDRDLGVIGGFSSEEDQRVIARCDTVLALGASLSSFTTMQGELIHPKQTIQVLDRHNAREPDIEFVPSMRIAADCLDFLRGLHTVLGIKTRPSGAGSYRVGGGPVPRSGARLTPEDGCDPVEALATLRRALSAPTQVLVGAGHFWNHVIEMPEPLAPERLQIHNGFGAIAHAFPAAIGAAIAAPNAPTVVIEGDGSLMMNLQEIETLVRTRAPVLIFVMNDGAYGAEYHKLKDSGLRAAESIFGYVDFMGVASALGCKAVAPSTMYEITEAVQRFLECPEPTLIDVRVSRKVVAWRYRKNFLKSVD